MEFDRFIARVTDEFILIFGIFVVVMAFEYLIGSKEKTSLENHLINILGIIYLLIFGTALMHFIQLKLPYLSIRKSPIINKYFYTFTFVLLFDLCYYFYHRLQHKLWPLWMIHKFHHTDPNVNVLTSHRTHFLERTMQLLLIGFPLLFILGYNLEAEKLMLTIFLFFLVYTHINIRIPGSSRFIVGSPESRQI